MLGELVTVPVNSFTRRGWTDLATFLSITRAWTQSPTRGRYLEQGWLLYMDSSWIKIENAYLTRNRFPVVKCFASSFDCSLFTTTYFETWILISAVWILAKLWRHSMSRRFLEYPTSIRIHGYYVKSGLRSRRFLGGVGFLRTLGVQQNNFLHRKFFTSHKLGILTRACWNGTICFETFIETDNSCCCTTISIIVSRYKTANRQISLMLCEGVRNFGKTGVGKFWKLGVGHFTSNTATLFETLLFLTRVVCCLHVRFFLEEHMF